MAHVLDSAKDCKLLYHGTTQNQGALMVLRSKLSAIAKRLNIPDSRRENMLLVAAELVSNNIKHAAGKGLIQVWLQPGQVLDIFSLDYGPGIPDLAQAEEDGYSSQNTLGKGLGSIRRLSDESHFYTQPQGTAKKWAGTAFLARFRMGAAYPNVGLFSRSLSDVRYNGDRIYLCETQDKLRWFHLDGLGHGIEAQAATSDLASCLSHFEDLEEALASADSQLESRRGAVAIFGEIEMKNRALKLLGVGDMHAHLYQDEQLRNIAFAPGILGREHRSPSLFETPISRKSVIVTATDGIRRNLDTSNFVGLFSQHPQLIAYVLGNIMGRISDDQSLFVTTVR
jgi:anti-sigma regulatory factor (Ser/Thr protein kinase)